MWTCARVVLLASAALALSRDQFYPYGPGLDQKLPRGAEVASEEIQLNPEVPVLFYGEEYTSIFVNNYGVLTFRAEISSFINSEFPLPYSSIAALYTNVDTTTSGAVYYRETTDSHALLKAEVTVQSNFHEYFDFRPRVVFVATWIDVTYDSRTDKKNSFQAAVISNGTETFVELLYPEQEIQWIQKETRPNASPEAKAQAGFIAEDGRVFTLKGSGSHLVRNIASWSNVHEPGKYVYRVGNIPPEGNIEEPDQYNQDVEEESTCAQSGPSLCHFQARCVDYQAGLCCQCNDGFYGNGKSCIKDDVPLRVHGKLNGNLNNVTLDNVDVQAYVVVVDGRSYTALSQAPTNLGGSLQLLNVIGSSIGWLFAKPLADAKNGYQQSGALFNHTAELLFPETNDKVTLSQMYLGHDVFDQITLDAEAEGTLPYVPNHFKLDIGEYDEQYTIVDIGVIKSESTRTFTDRATKKQYTVVISQQFCFSPCKHAPQDSEVTSTIKFFKNFLGYEAKENIIRYGMSTKVTPLGREDPCVAGRSTCREHSDCVVKGDSFQCVCQRGYRPNNYGVCIDLDECTESQHNCDVNAQCLNHEGGFRCICQSGYDGDGRVCRRSNTAYPYTPTPPSACSFKRCDPNAKCYETAQGANCVCNSGFKGDGSFCWDVTDCNSCSPYAECVRQDPRTPCRCRPGYVGNGYTCDREQTTTEQYREQPHSSQNPTAVDPNAGDIELAVCDDELNCVCPEGFEMFVDEQQITLCRLLVYYPTVEGTGETEVHNTSIKCQSESDCPSNAVCSYSEASGDYECMCPEGYEGDGYECVERATGCSCGPHSHCLPGELNQCSCDPGYSSDGYQCRPNSRCTVNSDCEYHAECRPDALTNDYLCQCIDGYKKDQNDACIPDGACNGAICAQHASCLYDREEYINYCSCDQGYTGNPLDRCDLIQNLELAETCDVRPDVCSPDAQCTYNQLGYSYECVCKEGFAGDGYSCNPEASCRNEPWMCDAHASCLRRGEGFVCECNTGYSGNGSVCALNPRQLGNFLVASDGMFIYRVPFQVSTHDFATPLNKVSDQLAVAIDVDCQTQRVYWSDLFTSTIKSSAYDGSDFQPFLTEGIKSPEGISIDWSARNIFWTDSKKKTIEVANLDTKRRKVLFAEGILNPRGIATHPQRGKIFWTDWNRSNPKIEWASMDGSSRGVFLGKPQVQLPNALAIEFSSDRLCYSDAGLKTIECVQMDTMQRDTIAKDCDYPFGLAINKGTFYWTDWETQKIEYVNYLSKVKGYLPIATSSKKLYGVAVALDQCAVYSNVCQYYNGNCGIDEICLPDGRGNRTCVTAQ